MKRNRDRQRGAALAVSLIAITALLGLGALTVLSVQSETAAAGQSRFTQAALYAAESGTAAGMDFLRSRCNINTFFTDYVTSGNASPLSPPEIVGNKVKPGDPGNIFLKNLQLWYEVTILNNPDDPSFIPQNGLPFGDTDGIVILHSIGHGPDQTVAVVELKVLAPCVKDFCEREYAQRNVTSRNDANAACSPAITSSALRTFTPPQ